jgi:hypothetical protein
VGTFNQFTGNVNPAAEILFIRFGDGVKMP